MFDCQVGFMIFVWLTLLSSHFLRINWGTAPVGGFDEHKIVTNTVAYLNEGNNTMIDDMINGTIAMAGDLVMKGSDVVRDFIVTPNASPVPIHSDRMVNIEDMRIVNRHFINMIDQLNGVPQQIVQTITAIMAATGSYENIMESRDFISKFITHVMSYFNSNLLHDYSAEKFM